MFAYEAEDVSEALQFGLEHILQEGVTESSRNGSVIVAPGPVLVEYVNPRRRVLFSPTRDANPVFHLMESLWMLKGDWDIEFPVFFNSTYGQFSDDGKIMWDAYGHRWRQFFGHDQLNGIVEELCRTPSSRRCVLSMWNSFAQADFPHPLQREAWNEDLGLAVEGCKAVPCNTHAYFAIRNDKLNMTVMNRSNDAIWGAFGANAVHFSFLLEYMAARIGVPIGKYYQFTNNLHVYTDKMSVEKMKALSDELDEVGDYPSCGPSIEEGFDEDLNQFMPWARAVIRAEGDKEGPEITTNIPDMKTEFMWGVVVPVFLFWVYRKWKDEYSSGICLDGITAPDWKKACREWAERRSK